MLSEKIERQVEELHVKYGIKTVPVPIEKVADQLGIVVKRAPSVDFSGLLLRKNGRAFIGINNSESSVRQRFTVAHEFGHFFLHKTQEAFVDYRKEMMEGETKSQKEREADMFAAAFIMPRSHLISDIKKITSTSILDTEILSLAKKCNVSRGAMTYRLINLGLILGK